MVLRGTEELVEQLLVNHVVLLVDPKSFQQVVGMILVIRVELLEPLLGFLDHVVRVPFAQFNTGAVSDYVGRVLRW